jgi:hypothetical protein
MTKVFYPHTCLRQVAVGAGRVAWPSLCPPLGVPYGSEASQMGTGDAELIVNLGGLLVVRI